MYCPRINHFVRLHSSGNIGKCGHMINGKGFKTFKQLDQSQWLNRIRTQMIFDEWPDECQRCQETEKIDGESIRTKSIERHKVLHPKHKEYLVVGGVLDNVCNSACQTCGPRWSTKIGSLESKKYMRVNNLDVFYKLPQRRILEIDVNGGEPTASKNYKKLISNVPKNTKIVRMNTNGSRMINEIIPLLEKGIMVIVTLSFDGVGNVHDYVRWPILWKNYTKTIDRYLKLKEKYKLLKLNLWTTVSALNILDFDNIIAFAKKKNIVHAYGLLHEPDAVNVKYKNKFTLEAKGKLQHEIKKHIATTKDNSEQLDLFIKKQDYLRKININDYLSFLPNLLKNNSAKAK